MGRQLPPALHAVWMLLLWLLLRRAQGMVIFICSPCYVVMMQ